MRRAIAAGALVLSGCAGLLGIEPAVLADDGGGTHVVGRAVREVVSNSADGTPVLRAEVAELEQVSVRVLRDGTWVDAPVDVQPEQLAFDVPAPATPYRLVAFVDGQPIELQHTAPAVTVVARSLGRRDAVPVTLPTSILFPSIPPPDFTVIASTGQWSFTQATDTQLDWRTAGSLGGGPIGLLSAAAGDRLFDLGYSQTGAGSTIAIGISRASATDVEMRDGDPVLLSAAPVPLALDRCAVVIADQRIDEARIRSAYAGATFRQDAISIGAAANPRFAFAAVPLSLSATTQPATDAFDQKVSYANPFPGHRPTAVAATLFERNTESITIERAQLIEDETCAVPQRLDGPISLPTAFAFGDTPLVVDNTVVSLGGGEPVLSWGSDGGGAADAYVVQLVEVVPGGPQPIRTIMTTKTEAPIDPQLLLVDHQYLVRITAVVGMPGAITGDFSSFELPYAEAHASSLTFRVAR